MSSLLPTFLRLLDQPSINNVLLCGCGGGFDFVHSLVLYPELLRLGKTVVIGSYSFSDPEEIRGEADVVFGEDDTIVKRVSARSIPDPDYGPEVHACSFLDERYPDAGPHFAYAYYAPAFTVPLLRRLYQQFMREHCIDAVIVVDGGSDSLMVGDENGLGTPIEDAVSVTAVASLEGLKLKILISIGLGTDRYHDVSDCASLRAIAELTARGGYLGAVSLEPKAPGFLFYKDCLEHIYDRQEFRSVLAGTIVSAVEGYFGCRTIPPLLASRIQGRSPFFWPPMAVLWAFDIEKVVERSMIADWIRECRTVRECYETLWDRRRDLGLRLRDAENLPRHEEMRRRG